MNTYIAKLYRGFGKIDNKQVVRQFDHSADNQLEFIENHLKPHPAYNRIRGNRIFSMISDQYSDRIIDFWEITIVRTKSDETHQEYLRTIGKGENAERKMKRQAKDDRKEREKKRYIGSLSREPLQLRYKKHSW